MKSAVRWILVLLAASAFLVIDAERAPARSCGVTCVTTTTAPPTTNPPSPYQAQFTPCWSGSTAGPCDQIPSQIEVTYPPTAAPLAVQLNWVADNRDQAAPNPDSTSDTLPLSAGTNCGPNSTCWSWPQDMLDGAYLLNGTYQVVPCASYDPNSGTCPPGSTLQPQTLSVAVAPGAPGAVTAASSGSEVTVSWKPPAAAPPDLAGYEVTRGSDIIYTCSPDALGPAASTPCPTSLTIADHPANGRYTYTVTALRLGVDSSDANIVFSAPAGDGGGVVTVPGPVSITTPNSTGPGTDIQESPVPTYYQSVSGPPGTKVTTVPATTVPVTTPPAPNPTSAPKKPSRSSALALTVSTPAGPTDVLPVGVLAIGILGLAIAAHYLYIKVELGIPKPEGR